MQEFLIGLIGPELHAVRNCLGKTLVGNDYHEVLRRIKHQLHAGDSRPRSTLLYHSMLQIRSALVRH